MLSPSSAHKSGLRRLALGPFLSVSLLAGITFAGCSAGSDGPSGDGDAVGDGDSTIDVTGGTSGDGDGDSSGDGDLAGDGDSNIDIPTGGNTGGDGDGDEEYCNDFAQTFEPKTPTVYVLVDRSNSMGENQEGFWAPLRDALLPAVQALQADVRFGFGTYTSTMASQCSASVLDDLGVIDKNNYDAIAQMYNEYIDPGMDNTAADTPTSFALAEATEILLGDPSPGERYIVLVTDGNPDFCDNVVNTCGQDVTLLQLQESYEQGVSTIVFGLEAVNDPIDATVMDLFANAGAGQPINWAEAEVDETMGGHSQLHYDCMGSSVWNEAATNGENAATYGASTGTEEAFLSADPSALVTTLQATVAGLKSCTFEFNFEVTDASTGEIFVGDLMTPIPQDQWRMVPDTPENNVLELLGDACTKWQEPTTFDFFAGFPCEAIVEIIR